jgi:NAD-dependent dihydropyrimidine dehydrogenase PreA subunit
MTKYIQERSCDFTKYPKLFEKTYWGSYNKLSDFEKDSENIIGMNRNKLAESYNLKETIMNNKITKKIRKQTELIFNGREIRDHIEYYKTTDNKILTIFSTDCINDKECEFIIQQGYILFEPLYSNLQKSYLKII